MTLATQLKAVVEAIGHDIKLNNYAMYEAPEIGGQSDGQVMYVNIDFDSNSAYIYEMTGSTVFNVSVPLFGESETTTCILFLRVSNVGTLDWGSHVALADNLPLLMVNKTYICVYMRLPNILRDDGGTPPKWLLNVVGPINTPW